MILLVDSGATNSNWKFINEDETSTTYKCRGFNVSTANIQSLECPISSFNEKVTKIFYFGAGTGFPEKERALREKLSSEYPISKSIFIGSDLHIAGLALSFNKRGVISILGTGSNCCLFDGINIERGVNNLGFILGDEGSGYAMGRRILKDFFYHQMNQEDKTKFDEHFQLSRGELIKKVYYEDSPSNTYIASFSNFLKYASDQYKERVSSEIISKFFELQISQFKEHKDLEHHFSGSISWHFQNQIKDLCLKYGLKIGNILQNPIDSLTYSKLIQI